MPSSSFPTLTPSLSWNGAHNSTGVKSDGHNWSAIAETYRSVISILIVKDVGDVFSWLSPEELQVEEDTTQFLDMTTRVALLG